LIPFKLNHIPPSGDHPFLLTIILYTTSPKMVSRTFTPFMITSRTSRSSPSPYTPYEEMRER
jgi:hypothetical protein